MIHAAHVCTAPGPVALDPVAALAHGFAPCDLTHAPAGLVLVALDGTTLRVTPEGALDPVVPFGRRSIASDPAARVTSSLTAHRRTP